MHELLPSSGRRGGGRLHTLVVRRFQLRGISLSLLCLRTVLSLFLPFFPPPPRPRSNLRLHALIQHVGTARRHGDSRGLRSSSGSLLSPHTRTPRSLLLSPDPPSAARLLAFTFSRSVSLSLSLSLSLCSLLFLEPFKDGRSAAERTQTARGDH